MNSSAVSAHKLEIFLAGIASVLLFYGIASGILFMQQHKNTFYPNVFIDNINVGGKTRAEAQNILTEHEHTTSESSTIFTIYADGSSVSSSAAQLTIHQDTQTASEQAFAADRNHLVMSQLEYFFLGREPKKEFFTTQSADDTKLLALISQLKKKVDHAAEEPSVTLNTTQVASSLKVSSGKDGQTLDVSATEKAFIDQLNQHHKTPSPTASIAAVLSIQHQQLPDTEVKDAITRAQKLVGKSVTFNINNHQQVLNDQVLVSFLSLPTGFSDTKIQTQLEKWKIGIENPPRDAVFEYDKQTLKVKKFIPPQSGQSFNSDEAKQKLIAALQQLETTDQKTESIDLPITTQPPEITLDKTNDLGINESIGFGESDYHHSIPGRIHNVALTASRINNIIVAPGAEFSFNKTLGDVSAATGFEPAYVISEGRTVLGDGGGVCQVSSTLFRALLNSGLPVTKRHEHSYRVSYYELNSKPGFDATVYAGDVDLRFVNDTRNYLLIHTETDSTNLHMSVNLYGTSDGRKTEIVDYKNWDAVPAPPPRYQDDATIPRGHVKQVDFAAAGIKVSYTNVVKDKSGTVIREDKYFSLYHPWQAVFLRGV